MPCPLMARKAADLIFHIRTNFPTSEGTLVMATKYRLQGGRVMKFPPKVLQVLRKFKQAQSKGKVLSQDVSNPG